MNDDDWKRLMVFASNQYVFEHKDLSFCLTAGCAQINEIKSVDYTWISNQYFKCELCRAEFCVDCKVIVELFSKPITQEKLALNQQKIRCSANT
jgi:hypothetical protein